MLLSQFQPIFVSFVTISAVLSVSRPCCLLKFYPNRVLFMCLKTSKVKIALSSLNFKTCRFAY